MAAELRPVCRGSAGKVLAQGSSWPPFTGGSPVVVGAQGRQLGQFGIGQLGQLPVGQLGQRRLAGAQYRVGQGALGLQHLG
ncbi:hypothetical protein, partial [Streptomyces lavendulae]|uniref:hypothetical protein n=1 Tax=Streptomyces lavendulae TaxID=1914 RepID=UPI0033CF1EC6